VSDQLLFILKLCLLALLYLFFFRVLRAVWAEIKAPAMAAPAGPVPAEAARRGSRRARKEARAEAPAPPQLVALEPPALRGRSFPLSEEVTLGRAAGCQITLDDTYISQLHARVYARDGRWLVEDLGSTNGTYLNRQRVSGPMVMHAGDRLQVGNTVLELR
jgi:pSer/pThr/pTyr-binding forkhead associated (FHA) protein